MSVSTQGDTREAGRSGEGVTSKVSNIERPIFFALLMLFDIGSVIITPCRDVSASSLIDITSSLRSESCNK